MSYLQQLQALLSTGGDNGKGPSNTYTGPLPLPIGNPGDEGPRGPHGIQGYQVKTTTTL